MSEFRLRARPWGHASISYSEESPAALERLGSDPSKAELGRAAIRGLFETPSRRVVSGVLAATAIAASVVALTMPSARVAAAPEDKFPVTLRAVTAHGDPYYNCLTVQVTGPGGASETVEAFLSKALPSVPISLFPGTNVLDTNRGDYPAGDIGGVGPSNPSTFTVPESGKTVTVIVPDTGGTCPTPAVLPSSDSPGPQYAFSGNVVVNNNAVGYAHSGNVSAQSP